MPTAVGKRIKELREKRGISRAVMAHALDIRESKIQDIERGKQKVPSDLLTQLSKYFDVDIEYILTGARSKNLDHVAEEAGTYKAEKGAGALSREEEVLVDKYRHLKPGDRTRAQALVDVLASAGVKKDKTG